MIYKTNIHTYGLEIFICLHKRGNKRTWEDRKPLISAQACRNGSQDIVQQILLCVFGSASSVVPIK
jgi:hypothetical protein